VGGDALFDNGDGQEDRKSRTEESGEAVKRGAVCAVHRRGACEFTGHNGNGAESFLCVLAARIRVRLESPGPALSSSGRLVHDIFGAMSWLTWSLLSAVFAAATAILAKLGVKGINANVATAVRTSVVVVFTWLLAYITRQPASFQAFSKKTWIFLRNGAFVALLFSRIAGRPCLTSRPD